MVAVICFLVKKKKKDTCWHQTEINDSNINSEAFESPKQLKDS